MSPPAAVRRLPYVPSLSWDDCRLLVDSVVDYAIYMLDTEGRVATWNVGAQRIKGYRAEEIIGQHFSKFYTPEDVAAGKPERELETARNEGRAEDEGWRVRKDGTTFWANVIVAALRDASGELRGYAKVTRDMTKRREADEQLRVSEQRFHHLVDAVSDYAIFMLDADGCVATWNAGAKRIKGYAPEEIIGTHFSRFYPEEDRAAGRPARILDTVRREGRFEEEGWRVRKDGTRFWASVVLTALRDETGTLAGFAKVTRDLSARREAEEELRRSEERFRLLVDSITDYAIYMLDPHGNVTTWNRGAERMKGYRPEEIVGRSFSAFFTEEDIESGKPARELAIAARDGRFEDEGWRVRKDGRRFWANVVLTALRDANDELVGFAKITRDLTTKKQAEETERTLFREQTARAFAEESARRAEEANRIKDEFLATVSHELRTPLNAIVGWASILRSKKDLDGEVTRAIEVIDRNARAQVKIVEDILDVSRIITGKLRIEPRPTDLCAVVHEAVEVTRPSAQTKRISLSIDAPHDACMIIGDPERLQQVAWNLLSNAVKFTDEGGAVAVRIRRDGRNVVFDVTDTGKGISADFLPYVFDRFRQADGSTTRRFGGLGLGLALVRHIVELHGGTVRATSGGPGAGSTFTVVLPVQAEVPAVRHDSTASSVPPVARWPATHELDGVTVLVVDDDDDARALIAIVLRDAGAVVTTAANARDALDAIRRDHPRVLVSDIAMPHEDGYALIRSVRALPAAEGGHIASVAITAYTRAEDRTKALAAGFTTHIGKPVNPGDLVAAVANLAALTRA